MIKVDAKFAFVLFVPFCGQFVLLRSIDVDRASNNTPGGSRRLRGRRGDVQVSESVRETRVSVEVKSFHDDQNYNTTAMTVK